MPPSLALAFFIIYLVAVMRFDRKQYPNVSGAIWLPTIWLLYASSKPLGAWFGSPAQAVELGSPLDRNFLIILICAAVWILHRRYPSWTNAIRQNPLLIGLFIFMLISILWSPIPFVSFKRWIREVLAVVMALVLFSEKDSRQAIQIVLRRTIYIHVPLSLVLIKYFPLYGRIYHRWSGMQIWAGVADQKNGLGQLASFAAFFLIWSLIKRWRNPDEKGFRYQNALEIFILVLSLLLLKGPPDQFSATSVVMLVAGLFFFFGLLLLKRNHKHLNENTLAVIAGLLIVYGTVTPLIGKLPAGDISASLGRDSTLTGRNQIWATLVPIAMSKPILGHGFGGFWTSITAESYYFPAHNGFLEVLLVLGFVGLILISIYLLSSCRKAQQELENDYYWGAFWISWLIMAVINNIAESSLNSFSNILMAIPVWLTICYKPK